MCVRLWCTDYQPEANFLHFCLERLQQKYSDLVRVETLNVMRFWKSYLN